MGGLQVLCLGLGASFFLTLYDIYKSKKVVKDGKSENKKDVSIEKKVTKVKDVVSNNND